MTTEIVHIRPRAEGARAIRGVLGEIMTDNALLNREKLFNEAVVWAQELPRRFRRTFYRFEDEEAPTLLVTDNPVLLDSVAPTPRRHVEMDHGGVPRTDAS